MTPTNKKIGFVTSNDYADLTESDRIAVNVLREKGMDTVPVIWDDSSVDWRSFDLLIIRSTWDYHLHPGRFASWLDTLELQQATVWNPIHIIRWNMNKRYLLELERDGIQIPRTNFIGKNESYDLSSLRSSLGTGNVVIKPVISASAWNTWRCSLDEFSETHRTRMNALLSEGDAMVQEFMPEIGTDGEWSLLFFGTEFSHAVRKFPADKDFRVQEELGGRYQIERNPPPLAICQARKALALIHEPLLYARVDGIMRNSMFIMMELELLEPALFFDVEPAAAHRFTQRLIDLTQ